MTEALQTTAGRLMALFGPQVCDAAKLVTIKSRFVLEMQTILENATGIKELYEQAQVAAAPEVEAAASVGADAAPQGADAAGGAAPGSGQKKRRLSALSPPVWMTNAGVSSSNGAPPVTSVLNVGDVGFDFGLELYLATPPKKPDGCDPAGCVMALDPVAHWKEVGAE